MKKIFLLGALIVFSMSSPAFAVDNCDYDAGEDFCVTPTNAYFSVMGNPNAIILDVRTPEELQYVGYPAANRLGHGVPSEQVKFADWKGKSFLNDVNEIIDDLEETGIVNPMIYTICRSGGRSYAAAKALMAAGYTNVLNINDGFEGDRNPATGTGYRDYNGWVAEGLPYKK